MNNFILVSIFSLLTVACSHIPDRSSSLDSQQYQLSYQRFTYGLQPVDESFIDDGLNLVFPVIRGSIFGSPSELILQITPAEAGRFTLNVPQEIDVLASEIQEENLQVQPRDTRVLRMGTFHTYPYYQTLGDGGFINGKNGNALVFVYFSQSSSITGQLAQYGEIFEHEVSIDQAGWHWLEISKEEQNNYRVGNYEGDNEDIYFAVLLDEMAAMR